MLLLISVFVSFGSVDVVVVVVVVVGVVSVIVVRGDCLCWCIWCRC